MTGTIRTGAPLGGCLNWNDNFLTRGDLAALKKKMAAGTRNELDGLGTPVRRPGHGHQEKVAANSANVAVWKTTILQLARDLLEKENPDLTAMHLMLALVPDTPEFVNVRDADWANLSDPRPARPYDIPVGLADVWGFVEKAVKDAAAQLGGWLACSDANAVRMGYRHRRGLRYEPAKRQWYAWNVSVWRRDEKLTAFTAARSICREAAHNTNAPLSAHPVDDVLKFAGSDGRLVIAPDEWDGNPNLFNTPGCVVDLESGKTLSNRPEDHMRKIAGAAPGATANCPRWDDFLRRAFDGDKELIAFMQRFAGYCLTGDVSEHKFLFLYGPSRTGKSTFVETLSRVLGDYAHTAPSSAFLQSKSSTYEKHSTDIAALNGPRLVTIGEVPKGEWNTTLLKHLTGGERINARKMRQDGLQFLPQCKLVFSGNEKPDLDDVDSAIRERLLLVPFMIVIPEGDRDHHLKEKLVGELPGILRWLIDGCLDWRNCGLRPPVSVIEPSREYFESQDLLGMWLEECCETGRGLEETSGNLWESWKDWAFSAREDAGSQKSLGQKLGNRSFPSKKVHGERGRGGIKLKQKQGRKT
jgi:P4 family phage/plasmid primase-like protien